MEKSQSESAILSRYLIIISNSISNQHIRDTMAPFGYDLTKLNECLALIETVRDLQTTQQRKKGEQIGSSEKFKVALAELTAIHRRHRKSAKLAFEFSPELLMVLGLEGKLSQNFLPFMASAELFYERISSDHSLLGPLAPLSITLATIEEMKAKIFQVKELQREHLRCKAESEKVTTAKKKNFAILKKWITRYMAVVTIAASVTGFSDIVRTLEGRKGE